MGTHTALQTYRGWVISLVQLFSLQKLSVGGATPLSVPHLCFQVYVMWDFPLYAVLFDWQALSLSVWEYLEPMVLELACGHSMVPSVLGTELGVCLE